MHRIRLPEDAGGWAVMDAGLAEARRRFGPRLEAAYAIGSLAHGGFAPAASDVDLALILTGLDGSESEAAAAIREAVSAEIGTALAGRLSIFWSVWAELERGSGAGRFPIADRQDLAASGWILAGEDRRDRIRLPTGEDLRRELLREGAAFMLEKLATEERDCLLLAPEHLVAKGCREVTKAVLFPVRFLCTARTGLPAGNREAVEIVAAEAEGGARALVLAAYHWRLSGRLDEAGHAVWLLREGVVPLHLLAIEAYRSELVRHGETTLAAGLAEWGRRLSSTQEGEKTA